MTQDEVEVAGDAEEELDKLFRWMTGSNVIPMAPFELIRRRHFMSLEWKTWRVFLLLSFVAVPRTQIESPEIKVHQTLSSFLINTDMISRWIDDSGDLELGDISIPEVSSLQKIWMINKLWILIKYSNGIFSGQWDCIWSIATMRRFTSRNVLMDGSISRLTTSEGRRFDS